MVDDCRLPPPPWWEAVCPTNLDRELCRQFLSIPSHHIGTDENGHLTLSAKERPCSIAEYYTDFATRLAKLWYASRDKARLAPDSPDRYGRWDDKRWIYNWTDEFAGELPPEIHERVSAELLTIRPELEQKITPDERWSWARLTANHTRYREKWVAEIAEFLLKHPITSIHYVGRLDDALCQAIVDAGRYKLTGKSMSGRYETPPGFLFDEDLNLVFFSLPPWLDGIRLYRDGAPRVPDVWIFDWTWPSPDSFRNLLMSPYCNWRAPYVVLIDPAIEHGQDAMYEWSGSETVRFGVLRDEHMVILPPEVLARERESDARMRGERRAD